MTGTLIGINRMCYRWGGYNLNKGLLNVLVFLLSSISYGQAAITCPAPLDLNTKVELCPYAVNGDVLLNEQCLYKYNGEDTYMDEWWPLTFQSGVFTGLRFACCCKGYGVLKQYSPPQLIFKCMVDYRVTRTDTNSDSNYQLPFRSNKNFMTGYRGYIIQIGDLDYKRIVVELTLISADNIGYHTVNFVAGTKVTNTITETYYCFDGSTISGWAYKYHHLEPYFTALKAYCKVQTCAAGEYPSTDGINCLLCPTATYSPGGNRVCSPCSNGGPGAEYSSSSGLTSNTCGFTCNAGYFLQSSTCVLCYAGKYKDLKGNSDACSDCPAGKYSSTSGAITCIDCVAGLTYQNNQGTSKCEFCTVPSFVDGYYAPFCTVILNSYSQRCPSCGTGNELIDPVCWGLNRAPSPTPQCKPCPVGKYQSIGFDATNPNSNPGACLYCSTGFYTSTTGSVSCSSCTNKPANSVYVLTGGSSPNCPYQCNAGYGTTSCTACLKGYYNPVNYPPQACLACTIKPQNSYFLNPVVFARDSDACPWDCNAGFEKDSITGNCISCNTGYYSSVLRTSDDKSANRCVMCTECTPGVTYQTRACSTTLNRICTSCLTTCSPGYYITPCTSSSQRICNKCNQLLFCKSGQHISGSCSGSTTFDTSSCKNCSLPSICAPGLFMKPNQCTGKTTQDSQCQVCQVLSCPFGTYQKACGWYNDTSCVPYTQCKAGITTLRNRGPFNNGVCMNCTNCSAYGLKTILNCSQYQDTLCSGVPCSGASPCSNQADRSFYCDFGTYGSQYVNSTSQGVCGMCPYGYSSDGMFCYECPRLKTCNRLGDVWCKGEVSLGLEPGCYGDFAQPTGNLCPLPTDPTNARIVTRSTFWKPDGVCAPYFQCISGYFKHFYAVGNAECEPCTSTSALPLNFVWFSQGLSFNDPYSCMMGCNGVDAWPDGNCSRAFATTYVPSHPSGFYDDGTGTDKPCNSGFTSLANMATSINDCKSCFVFSDTLSDPCGEWTCQYGQIKKGDRCYDPTQCPDSIGYKYALNGFCSLISLPWQKPGWTKTITGAVSGVNVIFRQENNKTVRLAPVVLVYNQSYANISLVFYSNPYGQHKRHWFSPNITSKNISLPGQVCSATGFTFRNRKYVLVVFCNTTFISFLDLQLATPIPRLLIGGSMPGYAEGFRDQARFNEELYIAVEGGGPNIYVSDRLNCAIRYVSIPTDVWPGSFLTRSYWVYGSSAGSCRITEQSVLFPGRLFGIISQSMFLFFTSVGMYQMDSRTRNVVEVFSLSVIPNWMSGLDQLLDIELGGSDNMNVSELRLRFANFTAVVIPNQQRCDQGTTSLVGGDCAIQCPIASSYVDPDTGLCKLCFTRECLVGEGRVSCTPSSPQICVECPSLDPFMGVYPRIYALAGSCDVEKTVFVTFCQKGMYLSSTPGLDGLKRCIQCPRFSTTDQDGATSIDQCRCFPGTARSQSGECIAGQLYPLPSVSKCPLGAYPRGSTERCTSCRVDPFPECQVGQYPMLNGSCLPCLLPFNSFFKSNGKVVGSLTSCGFECFPGYYQTTNGSFQSRCQPCTNTPSVGSSGAQFYAVTNGQLGAPQGCTWACMPPFKIYLGQCVQCALVNLEHPGAACTHPWLSVNTSSGNGTRGVLNGVSYRMISFNASGEFRFSHNTTVDLLIVAGGGAGGGVPNGIVGAGGGGGAGQVLLLYNVSVLPYVTYTVTVGASGMPSSVMQFTAVPGGAGGYGTGNAGAQGGAGASGGGSGSTGIPPYVKLSSSQSGYPGGADTVGSLGAGGGGSGCQGGSTAQCQAGDGGCGTVLWTNSSLTFFDPMFNLAVAGGGGGGSSLQGCPSGVGAAGGGSGASGPSNDGQNALPNTGAGGGGGSVNGAGALNGAKGGDGGSGLVILRFLDESCGCAV